MHTHTSLSICILQITSAQITKLEELWKENPEATLEGERERRGLCVLYVLYYIDVYTYVHTHTHIYISNHPTPPPP